MSMEHIVTAVRGFDGALVITAEPGGGHPEPAWGDSFFYYAPDGRMPVHTQLYGTVVTRNQPGDDACDLDPADRWRVNVHVDRATFRELTGEEPRTPTRSWDCTAVDTVLPHPVYRAQGWLCVVNPGGRTTDTVVRLLGAAHEAARARSARRGSAGRGSARRGSAGRG